LAIGVVVGLAVLGTALLHLMRADTQDNAPRELHAKIALWRIYDCEQRFRVREGRYGALNEIARDLDASFVWTDGVVTRKDYRFSLHVCEDRVTPLGSWYAYAWPIRDGSAYWTFVIWSNSFIYGTKRAYSGDDTPAKDAAVPASGSGEQAESYIGLDGSVWRHVG
jgi:hypothetical protein